MGKLGRRAVVFGAGAAAGVAGARWLKSDVPVLAGTRPLGPQAAANTLNDASGLSQTPIAKHVILTDDPGESLVAALRAELKEAAAAGRPVNLGAARHSMGGQAIPRGGTAITHDNARITLDSAARRYLAPAGARWHQVIAQLDPVGASPAVMQSNSDFGLAATFSVNAHGWPVPYGPMGATVHRLTMVLPDGELVSASRSENAELFAMAMGGYGLIGLITELEVDMVDNQRLLPSFTRMEAEAFAPAFRAAVDDPEVPMAYGRLNVGREGFMSEALLITYRADPDSTEMPPAAYASGLTSRAAARLYRWQLGNERMKRFRWWTEARFAPVMAGAATRSALMNEPVLTLDDRDERRTDILHEYFVPFDRFSDFLRVCREVIPASYQEFLNVTLRFVDTDGESWLSYARVPRIAAVMSFSQEMTERGEADMARMTRALIEGINRIGGAYYLPYRPHATLDQLQTAYPRAAEFAARKREIDPGLLLRNNLWDSYLGQL
ncbi:FAD-binding oxidoreductase [Oceanicola sp. 502str15]|uniref:FAD-binding oxidoreductase n=1 Tax=Oceanicola sp. 502str15 TaxID=2696061 RepID=UPI002095F0ED|nr:FAD-binding oxidoreductase [Oceanicola sp. 502str15]MCO6384498.1 FAD-binding protein [Oceanicola sp. 502str15]